MRTIKIKGLILAFWLLLTNASGQEQTPELYVQTGHSESIGVIAFSPDGARALHLEGVGRRAGG